MGAFGYLVLVIVVLGVIGWVRRVRNSNTECCNETPREVVVPRPAITSTPRKTRKKVVAKKSTKRSRKTA